MSINFSYDPLDEGFLPSDPEEPSIQDFLSNDESRANSPAIPNLYNNYGKDSQNLQANMTLENTTAPESNARDEMLLKQEDRVNSSLNEFNHISPSNIKKEETDEDNLTPKIYENQTPKKPTTKKLTTKKRTRENKRKTYIRKSREENPNHKGRRGKDSPYQGKHTDKSDDNGSKVIFTYFEKSLHNEIQEDVNSLFENKNIRISKKIKKIYVPTVTKRLTKSNEKKVSFLNEATQSIFINMKPKRVPANNKSYNHNKEVIPKILDFEQNDDTRKVKVLNLIFSAKIKVFIEAYLNDKREVIIDGVKITLNNSFKTISDFARKYSDKYTADDIKKFRKNIYRFLEKSEL